MNSIPDACPDVGAWRAWLDQETDPSDDSRHLDTCPGCQRVVDELRADATYAHDSLASLAAGALPTSADVAVARERLEWRYASHRRGANEPVGGAKPRASAEFLSRYSTPWRVAAGGIAAALVLGAVVAFTP